MKTETLMWLLPIVFMVHDFEEIIMFQPWLEHNASSLRKRFPRLASGLLTHFEKLSTSSFAFAVCEEFVLLSVATYITVELDLFSVWAGILLAFFAHLIVHIIQFAAYRRYTPAILSSVASSVYCLGALYRMNALNDLIWSDVAIWLAVALVVIAVNLVLMHALAERIEPSLQGRFRLG